MEDGQLAAWHQGYLSARFAALFVFGNSRHGPPSVLPVMDAQHSPRRGEVWGNQPALLYLASAKITPPTFPLISRSSTGGRHQGALGLRNRRIKSSKEELGLDHF